MPIGDDMPHLGFGTSVAFSPDGTRVVTGSAIPGGGRGNGTARLWDAHSGAPIGEVMKHEGRAAGTWLSAQTGRASSREAGITTPHRGSPSCGTHTPVSELERR